MSLVAAPESIGEHYDEWASLHAAHYDALALDKDRVPLDVNRDFYITADAAGTLSFVSLRDGGKLVGYLVAFVSPCPHYRILTAVMDVLWVSPEARGRFGGMRLLKAAEAEFRRRGVQRWFMGEKLHQPIGRLFKAHGFRPVETYHSKWLGPVPA